MKRATCENHGTRFADPTVYFTNPNRWYFISTSYAWSECQDCKETLWMWTNQAHLGKWHVWQLKDCSDHVMKVDATHANFKSYDPNPDYPFHLMFVAMVTHKPVQHWAEVDAVCGICGMKAIMQSEYDRYKENGEDKIRFHGWTAKQYLSRIDPR